MFSPSAKGLSALSVSLSAAARELGRFAVRRKDASKHKSPFDLEPLNLGKVLLPLGYENLLDEMLDDTRP